MQLRTFLIFNSITFDPGFETNNQDFFEAFIDPAADPCTITSETLATADMGKDGPGSLIAKDAFGFTPHYFDENTKHDYIPIGATTGLNSVNPSGFNFASLYNGNIGAMSVNIPQIGNPMLYNYRYDQLNRLKSVNAFKGLNPQTQSWEHISINDYKESISYDHNGNVLNYNRHGDAARIPMDSLLYSYKPNTN